MPLRTPEAPEQDVNPIDERYAEGLGSGFTQKDQGRAGVYATSDKAREARQRLQNSERNATSFGIHDNVQQQEESGTFSDPWVNKTTSQGPASQKQGFRASLANRLPGKKGAWTAGGLLAGGGIGITILISMLLPLKLVGILSNMSNLASRLPAYAVEQRTEQHFNRMLSTWLIRKGAGNTVTDADVDAVFCKNGSITCSYTWTRINKYFDDLYDLSNWEGIGVGDNTGRRVTITPRGRDSYGSFARSWNIDVERSLGGDSVKIQMDTLNSNAEMKRFIRDHVNNKMNTKSVITRFIARKALMKKYGVTNWRGFEKTSNNIAELRTSFKASLLNNTVGKINPKAATYLECLSGGTTCEKLKDQIASKIDTSPKGTDETEAEFKSRQAKNKAYQEAIGEVADLAVGEESAFKAISKKLALRFAGGAVAAAGVVDLIANAVANVDDGALESVIYDIRSAAYVGYAFGDESGIATNIEKFKAGAEVDSKVMEVMAEHLDEIEPSPVFQAETGLMNSTVSGEGYERSCNVDGTEKKVILKNSYVCPERQVAENVTEFMENPYAGFIVAIADVWNSTGGKLFDFADWVVDGIMKYTGLNSAITAVVEATFGGKLEEAIEWMVGIFFDVPTLGDEATGDQNYDALSAGVWISQNGTMEHGVENGDLLGGGGALLANEDIAAIQAEQYSEELESLNSQPYLARMFNTDSPNSFANRVLARIPVSTFTNSASILTLPSVAMASMSSVLNPSAQATVGPMNPHNIPLYGYAPGDPALTAAPTDPMFSEENCKASAEARMNDDNYVLDRDLYPIKVYKKADPCALERMVVGNILHDMGVKDDPNSFKEIDGNLNCGPFGGNTGGAVGVKMSETEFMQLFPQYSLPAPIAGDAPSNLGRVYGSPVAGYEELLARLKENPKAGWAAQQMLNGEKKWRDAGGSIKEYLTTTWLWFENNPTGWPDPYEMNCINDTDVMATHFCGSRNFQVAGYQPGDVQSKFKEVYDKLYSEDKLGSIMQQVIQNSTNASKDAWNYNDPSNSASLSSLGDLSSVTFADLWPNKDFGDPRAQRLSLILGKDPSMAAALNSFAVSDSDVIAHLGSGDGCGKGWGYYICKPHRQAMANIMMALYLFDGQGPAAGASCSARGASGSALPGWTITKDPSIEMGYRPSGVKEPQIKFRHAMLDNGNTDFGVSQLHGPGNSKFAIDNRNSIYGGYDFPSYGFDGVGHPGYDISMPLGTKLYSPVNGTVIVSGASGYFYNTEGTKNKKNIGELRIQLANGDEIIMGHMQKITVNVGDTVSPGTYVGESGYPGGPHLHLEYREKNSSCSSGFCILDPTEKIP